MQSIQIWRALPDETNLDNLIGDISITRPWPPIPNRVCVSVRQPKELAKEVRCIPGSLEKGYGKYSAQIHVRGALPLLDDASSASLVEPMLDDAGSHPLTLKVFDCERNGKELTRLTIVPRENDPFLCDAAWFPAFEDLNPVLTVRFWPFPVSPWAVLRAVTGLFNAELACGSGVAAFHHSIVDDFLALPRAAGLK